MNKKIFLTIFLFLGLISLNAQGLKNIKQIEFSTSSRNGDFKEVVITKKTANIMFGNRRENDKIVNIEKDLRKKDCKKLHKILKNIDIESIPELKSPTNNRAFDGADHSLIAIETIDNFKTEHRFDDLNPHPDLVSLQKFILELFPSKEGN